MNINKKSIDDILFIDVKNIKFRKVKCFILNLLIYTSIILISLLLIGIICYILFRGLPHITFDFLINKPSVVKGIVGIFPNILNTIYIIIMTLIIVVPIGIGAAIYLNEYAKNKKLVHIIELAIETLQGIPSIIYGLVGMLIFVQFLSFGTSLIAGAFTLAIMTLPLIIRTTEESLKSVPNAYREGALALGSGKWYMIRTVVLPSAIDGILTGTILSIGRIVGESAALLWTAGVANDILTVVESITPKNAGATLTVALYMYAKERGEFDIAFAIATILLILTFIINALSKFTTMLLRNKGAK